MALTEAQKRKIEEEEEYRANLRKERTQPAKKKTSIFTKIVLGLLIIFVGIPIGIGVIVSFLTPSSSSSTTSSTEQDTSELLGDVSARNGYVHITNNEDKDWKDCYFILNDDYYFPHNWTSSRLTIGAGQTSSIGFGEFVDKDNQMFNPYTYRPTKIAGSCGSRPGYWEWN